MKHTLLALVLMVVFTGCATTPYRAESDSVRMSTARDSEKTGDDVRADRMLIWNAYMTIEVNKVADSVTEVAAAVAQQDGYIEDKTESSDTTARITIRVPAASFETAISEIEKLGKVTYRSLSGTDVTEQYVDIAARLKNKIVLRDRLQKLLDKADEVKDVLAIEAELNRVQSDIDSMEARLKSLQGRVDYATLQLEIRHKVILGPVGYILKGLWWGVEKLFIIRE